MPQYQTLTRPGLIAPFVKELERTVHRLWTKVSYRLPKPKRWLYLGWFGGVQIYQTGRRP